MAHPDPRRRELLGRKAELRHDRELLSGAHGAPRLDLATLDLDSGVARLRTTRHAR
jgi:hypothetical protein